MKKLFFKTRFSYYTTCFNNFNLLVLNIVFFKNKKLIIIVKYFISYNFSMFIKIIKNGYS